MLLRPYQSAAILATVNFIKYCSGNGFVTSPGGSGKSVMIAYTAQECVDMGMQVIILARSEKLLTQNKAKFLPAYTDRIGIYCASLGEKDLSKQVTIASIQSIANAPIVGGSNMIVLVDECHAISNNTDDESQYWEFLKRIGNPRIIGYTATAFRTKGGKLSWGDEIISVPIKPLFDAGYLSPPINKVSNTPDLSQVTVVMGEYSQGELEDIYLNPDLLAASVIKLHEYSKSRNSVLIFTQSVKHGKILCDTMRLNSMDGIFVDGETDKQELSGIIERFNARQLKYLLSCSMLTEGYDLPPCDMIAVFKSTKSRTRWEQMVYRGTRLYEGKTNFLLLDCGGNLLEHGGLGAPYHVKSKKEEKPNTGKICPECESLVAPLTRVCPDCAYAFPEPAAPKINHNVNPDTKTSAIYEPKIEELRVTGVRYKEHKSKKGNATLMVEYLCPYAKYGAVRVYLSPHHKSDFARGKAAQFFAKHGNKLGSPIESYSMDDLIYHAASLKKPASISVDYGEEFPRVVGYQYEAALVDNSYELDDAIPF